MTDYFSAGEIEIQLFGYDEQSRCRGKTSFSASCFFLQTFDLLLDQAGILFCQVM